MHGTNSKCCISIYCVIIFIAVLHVEAHHCLEQNGTLKRISHYEMLRNEMLEREQSTQLGGSNSLTPQEQRVNERLMLAKSMEYDEGFKSPKDFKPAQHFFNAYEEIKQTVLFKMLMSMPKGAALHIHDTALGRTDFLMSLTYRQNLWVCLNKTMDTYVAMKFSRSQPEPISLCEWQLLQSLRQGDTDAAAKIDRKLRSQLTLYPRDKFHDLNAVWNGFRSIFKFITGLLTFKPIWAEYFYHVFEEFLADGVQYLEIRCTLPILYDLDNGYYTRNDTAQVLHDTVLNFKQANPGFLGAKLIFAPTRFENDSIFNENLQDAVQLKKRFPDFIAGFDLVGYEDAGRPLRDFAHRLLAVQHELDFYFHAGETNWYGTTTDENLIDAVLLGTKRIGHGLALLKHPEVLQQIRAKDIAIEVNPISNQVLQHLRDFRNHPCGYLFAGGYPVVVSSDDSSFWQATPLTHDFYIAFLGIASKSADLRLLKQLAYNSIYYSSMDKIQKEQAFESWNQMWLKWIDNFLNVKEF